MNLISHLIDSYIDDDEKKLAFKISIASFFIFITSLILIVFASYVYQRNTEYRDFVTENRFIENREILLDMSWSNLLDRGGPSRNAKHRGPRDIIIFDENKQVVKNDFFDLTTQDIYYLYTLQGIQNKSIEFMGHTYLISRNQIDNSTIFLFHDLTPIRDFHFTLLIISLVGSFIGLLIIYLLARYMAHITIAPIREKARELEGYSRNVAHELRTPLSVMRSNLDLLRIKPEARFIDSTDEEITGMERIIDSLLFLANPDTKIIQKELDITKKTAEIVEKYTPENTIRYIHEQKHIYNKCSEELYTRIICNLIENAIKYKSRGNIDIKLNKKSIEISNEFDHDLTDEEAINLTKIFYQWDVSRNSTGYGLGLALVSKIVDISGWSLHIRSRNKRFTVEVQF